MPSPRLLAAQQRLRGEVNADPSPARWGRVTLNLMPFEPVVDGRVLPLDPAAAPAAEAAPDIEILVGSNRDEFRLFTVPSGLYDHVGAAAARATAAAYGLDADDAITVYRCAYPEAGFGELHARLVTDWFYRVPALRLAEAYTRRRPGSAFVYAFAWQPPTFDGRLGACHALESPFVFDALEDKGFAGLLGPTPPAHLTEQRANMCFDLTSEVVRDPRPAERELWKLARP